MQENINKKVYSFLIVTPLAEPELLLRLPKYIPHPQPCVNWTRVWIHHTLWGNGLGAAFPKIQILFFPFSPVWTKISHPDHSVLFLFNILSITSFEAFKKRRTWAVHREVQTHHLVLREDLSQQAATKSTRCARKHGISFKPPLVINHSSIRSSEDLSAFVTERLKLQPV